jgi:hypothetical protein
VVSCEHGDESSGSTKGGGFLDEMNGREPIKETELHGITC